MGKDHITVRSDLSSYIIVIPAYRETGEIAARHDEA